LRGVAAALANSNYEMVIYPVDSLNRLRAYLAALPITSNLDCLIIMSLPFTEEDSKRLKDHNIQTVVIEFHQDYFSSVVIDDFAGGLMAANYLIKKGHRRIAFIGDLNPPDYAIKPVLKRYNGLKHGLEEAGNLLPDEYVRSASFNQVPSRQQARQLLNLPEPPTAIFAATDAQAIAVMKVTRELGLRIPNDLAVIGFDDLDMADFVGLTTISQSLDDSGRVATELLLARIAEPNRPLQMVHLPLKIVERDTV
jgi:LacI family transcriptional regulator